MPFIKRDANGNITAVSQQQSVEFEEQIDSQDDELLNFMKSVSSSHVAMTQSDLDFVRVVEDIVELLISKNFIRFTDLPAEAQQKMRARQTLRGKMSYSLDLLSDDKTEVPL